MKKLIALLVGICSLSFGATLDQLNNYSGWVDSVLEKQYVEAKVRPLGRINDDTFVRRAYLSII